MRLTGLLRNREIRNTLVFYGVLGILFSLCLYLQAGVIAAVLGIVSCLLYSFLYLRFTGQRYRQLENLSAQIDEVLHGNASNIMDDCQEGEMAILHSELEKLLLHMREQSEQLQGEKRLLADALADISHQIKTPLTSIHLLLERLNEPDLDLEERREMLWEISSFIRRIDWLLYALLKISRLDAEVVQFQKMKISVRNLVQKAMEPLAVPMDIRGISWQSNISEEISFYGDPEWSGEAILNVLKNCMEYTPEDGEISVTAEENALYTRILIRDNGPDIPAEDLPHLFERFYRGSQSYGAGIGIGLSLTQKIIQSQNGTIRVSNRSEGGPQFEIRFYKSTI